MSANNKQAANVPKLCKSGCGFFGSEATGGCCSKCWMESIKNNKQTPEAAPVTVDVDNADNSEKITPAKTIDQCTVATPKPVKEEAETPASPTPAATAPLKKKKKKKKTGYKNMMATMMAGSDKKDIAKEKQLLAKSLGGGNFSKIEKI